MESKMYYTSFQVLKEQGYIQSLKINILYNVKSSNSQKKDNAEKDINVNSIFLCEKTWNQAINQYRSINKNLDLVHQKNPPKIIKNLIKEINSHLKGKAFNYIPFISILDLNFFTSKEKRVIKYLMKIKPGKIITYKKLAEKAGFLNAARFIGNTMKKNPFPLIIPCHRVIPTDSYKKLDKGKNHYPISFGNYQCGSDLKIKLLKSEGI